MIWLTFSKLKGGKTTKNQNKDQKLGGFSSYVNQRITKNNINNINNVYTPSNGNRENYIPINNNDNKKFFTFKKFNDRKFLSQQGVIMKKKVIFTRNTPEPEFALLRSNEKQI